MKNIRIFLSKNFQFLEVKFSVYLNRRVSVMYLDTPSYLDLRWQCRNSPPYKAVQCLIESL